MNNIFGPRTVATLAMFLTLPVASSRASADEHAAYESLSEVSIGRVFFSPKQRELLDRRRRGRPPVRRTVQAEAKPSEDSAGFIVNSAGQARIYSNGDFVVAAMKNTLDFPGDISVIRRETGPSQQADDGERETEPSDADD